MELLCGDIGLRLGCACSIDLMTLFMMRSASSVVMSPRLAENLWALYWLTNGEMVSPLGEWGELSWLDTCKSCKGDLWR